jgi:flagellar protein FlbD
MIEVTRLNGNLMVVNSDLIKSAEASPDTVLTLIHGDKLMVRESCVEIVEKIVVYRARLLAAVTALGGQHDLLRAVTLASQNAEAGKISATRPGSAPAAGPTLVTAEARSSEASL